MNSERVEEIQQVCGISAASYYRAVNELIKIGIITKNKLTYTISENMFWKGDRRMRSEIMNSKLGITFTPVFEDGNTEVK
jgi:DNA-binding IclR family transcriptional regulator